MNSCFEEALESMEKISNQAAKPLAPIEARTKSWQRDVDAEFIEMLASSFRDVPRSEYVKITTPDEFDQFFGGD